MKAAAPERHLPVVELRAEELPPASDAAAPAVGKWYHVKFDGKNGHDDQTYFLCVVHLGSNYVEFKTLTETSHRVHQDEFWDRCTYVDDPEAYIQGHVEAEQRALHALMENVRELTARLAITPGPALSSGNEETRALSTRHGESMGDYKASLVKAKEQTLPKLFEEIRKTHTAISQWMGAKLIPMKAQADAMKPAIQAVEERIFSVELYAGLQETLVQIAEGEPAPLTEKVRIFQRRAYMDEECLARYETGGMTFKDIKAFDRWLARPDNRDRILPFPRCIVAFRVRRNSKKYDDIFEQFIKLLSGKDYDKTTFLYIRNGEQLHRLTTTIDFGEKLFPDMDHASLTGKVYAYTHWEGVEKLISEAEYQGIVEEDRKRREEFERQEAENAKLPEGKRFMGGYFFPKAHEYTPFTRENVFYDDIRNFIQKQLAEHNRLVLVLQGLLDRSPALHPHPPWVLWNAESFAQAIEPIYDDARALQTGDAPDFAAYQTRCNAALKPGSVTVGQEDYWERREADKESERYYKLYGKPYYAKRLRPSGNPGPGKVARVLRIGRDGAGHFAWVRSHERWTARDGYVTKDHASRLKVPGKCLLNVDAYKPGDYRLFFDDPRTRADYLKWAPLLLLAEEYHAGNLKLRKDKPLPKRHATEEERRAYERRKRLRGFVRKIVRLTRDIQTKGGKRYKKGSLWLVESGRGDCFSLMAVKADGTDAGPDAEGDVQQIRNVGSYSFEVALDVVQPKRKKKTA